MRSCLVWSLLAVVSGCYPIDDTTPLPTTDTSVGTGGSTATAPESDCDGQDDDSNGVIDDGAAPGWLTDPTRWEQVATITSGANGSVALDLIDGPGGDGVYVTAAEVSASNWMDALVVYHLAEDGTLAEVGRHAISPPDGYLLHAAADPQGRIWFGAVVTTTNGASNEPLVMRFDPADGSWTTIIDDDPDSTFVVLGNVVPDAEGAWFAHGAQDAEGNVDWATARIASDDSWSVVDRWTLTDGSDSVPWLAAIDPDGVLWGVGTAYPEKSLPHGVVRAGLGDTGAHMVDTNLHLTGDWEEGYTDIAFDGVGRWFATHASFDYATSLRDDWRVIQGDRGLPGSWALWDEVPGGAAFTVVVHPTGTVFAGGSVTVAGSTSSLVRAGTAEGGFVTVFQGLQDVGRRGLAWDLFVDDDGVVWEMDDDSPLDYNGRRELRVRRLSCR